MRTWQDGNDMQTGIVRAAMTWCGRAALVAAALALGAVASAGPAAAGGSNCAIYRTRPGAERVVNWATIEQAAARRGVDAATVVEARAGHSDEILVYYGDVEYRRARGASRTTCDVVGPVSWTAIEQAAGAMGTDAAAVIEAETARGDEIFVVYAEDPDALTFEGYGDEPSVVFAEPSLAIGADDSEAVAYDEIRTVDWATIEQAAATQGMDPAALLETVAGPGETIFVEYVVPAEDEVAFAAEDEVVFAAEDEVVLAAEDEVIFADADELEFAEDEGVGLVSWVAIEQAAAAQGVGPAAVVEAAATPGDEIVVFYEGIDEGVVGLVRWAAIEQAAADLGLDEDTIVEAVLGDGEEVYVAFGEDILASVSGPADDADFVHGVDVYVEQSARDGC